MSYFFLTEDFGSETVVFGCLAAYVLVTYRPLPASRYTRLLLFLALAITHHPFEVVVNHPIDIGPCRECKIGCSSTELTTSLGSTTANGVVLVYITPGGVTLITIYRGYDTGRTLDVVGVSSTGVYNFE
jgi:hypothetical protein